MQQQFKEIYERRKSEAHSEEIRQDNNIAKIILTIWSILVVNILLFVLFNV